MSKIELDKYYTPKELVEYCVNKTKEIIGEQNIVEYLEPSAGGGVFLDYLDKPYLAYDIEPEDDRIVKQDYLNLDLERIPQRISQYCLIIVATVYLLSYIHILLNKNANMILLYYLQFV